MWIVKTEWQTSLEGISLDPVEVGYQDQEEARKYGLQCSCCRGCVKVEVYGPLGELAYSWEPGDNLWREHAA